MTDSPTEPSSDETTIEKVEQSNLGETADKDRGEESEIVIPGDPDAAGNGTLLNQQAMNAWKIGNIREAMALFEQAIDAGPNDPAPHSNYGRLLTLMTSYQEALPLLQHARELTPDDAQVWLDLATIYERTQVLEKSWEARAEATKLVGADAITRDEQGRFVVQGGEL